MYGPWNVPLMPVAPVSKHEPRVPPTPGIPTSLMQQRGPTFMIALTILPIRIATTSRAIVIRKR